MTGRQEKFSNSRGSRMAKTIIYWPWRQPFNSFCFETLSFFPLFPFFLFFFFSCVCVWGHGSPGVAGRDLRLTYLTLMFHFYAPKNIRKCLLFWHFHGEYKWNTRLKWVNHNYNFYHYRFKNNYRKARNYRRKTSIKLPTRINTRSERKNMNKNIFFSIYNAVVPLSSLIKHLVYKTLRIRYESHDIQYLFFSVI